MDKNGLIHFEYQDVKQNDGKIIRYVALDAKLTDFQPKPILKNGMPIMMIPSMTTKDCQHIDGCVYFHIGNTSDTEMIDLIEKFQKMLKEKSWKKNDGIQFKLQ